jgi:voltage-gated potassium channel
VNSLDLFDMKMKEKLHSVIFESDTSAGRTFDIILVIIILSNSILIIAESVDSIRNNYEMLIKALGWVFVIIFTIEYLLRIFISKRRCAYLLGFFGIIDLLAVLPAFFGLFLPEIRFLAVIRIFRLLRLFSILKMGRYIDESGHLIRALKASRPKITVFLFTILFIIIIVGSMMYIIEGPGNGFNSIPESMYWAIVTVTTVGYGDISPKTPMGKLVSSLLMILAYGILAVPTGIISHELAHTSKSTVNSKPCPHCYSGSYGQEDRFCSKCGKTLKTDRST